MSNQKVTASWTTRERLKRADRVNEIERKLAAAVVGNRDVLIDDAEIHDIQPIKKENLERYYVRNKKRKIVRFILKPAQVKLLGIINNLIRQKKPILIILLKSRQWGGSTLFCAILNELMVKYGLRVTIMGQDIDAAKTLWKKSELFFDRDPWPDKPDVTVRGPREKQYSNGGETWVGSADVKSVRCQTNNFVLVTELPKWPGTLPAIQEQLLGLFNSVPSESGNGILIESTAKGVDNEFHTRWMQAVRGENDFVPVFIGWLEDPDMWMAFKDKAERDAFKESLDEDPRFAGERELIEKHGAKLEQLKARRSKIKNECAGKPEEFRQEYPTTPEEAFLSTGRAKFDQVTLNNMLNNAPDPIFIGDCLYNKPIQWVTAAFDEKVIQDGFRSDRLGNLRVYEWPERYEDYCLGADVAEGLENHKGTDSSSITIIKRSTGATILSWWGKIHPEDFADLCTAIGLAYNQAFNCTEANFHGFTTLTRLSKQYPKHRIYRRSTDLETFSPGRSELLGFDTKEKSKSWVLDNLAYEIRNNILWVWDKPTIKELIGAMEDTRGKVETNGLDRLMSLAMAVEAKHKGKDLQRKPTESTSHQQWVLYMKGLENTEKENARIMKIREAHENNVEYLI